MNKGKKVYGYIKVVAVIFILMMITQKLGIKIGAFQVQPSLFLFPIIIAILIIHRKIFIKISNLHIYLVMTLISALLLIIQNSEDYSSYIYFVVIYLFFIFSFKLSIEDKKFILEVFMNLLFITGIIAIMQLFLQLMGFNYIDIFDYILPNYRLEGFNYYYPISYGAQIIKSNGWIYLEPSFLSQFMALGIIIILYQNTFEKKQIIQLVIFSLAILTSFSGTGILLLLFFIIPLLYRMNFKKMIVFVFGALLILYIFISSEYSYAVIGRINELSKTNSSASIRFINPFIEAFGENNQNKIIGNGPGSIKQISSERISNFSCIPKVMYEYGLLILLLFTGYVLNYFFKRNDCSLITIALLIMYFFLAGNLLQPNIVFGIIIINEATKSLKLENKNNK